MPPAASEQRKLEIPIKAKLRVVMGSALIDRFQPDVAHVRALLETRPDRAQ